MTDPRSELRLKAAKDDIVAAMEHDDYQWFVENVFIPALAQITPPPPVKGSTLPRSRRPAGTRVHSHHRARRSHRFRP
jgi:hypothetical protein